MYCTAKRTNEQRNKPGDPLSARGFNSDKEKEAKKAGRQRQAFRPAHSTAALPVDSHCLLSKRRLATRCPIALYACAVAPASSPRAPRGDGAVDAGCRARARRLPPPRRRLPPRRPVARHGRAGRVPRGVGGPGRGPAVRGAGARRRRREGRARARRPEAQPNRQARTFLPGLIIIGVLALKKRIISVLP
jgi:hypothetical protein